MNTANLITLISTALVALSQPAWAGIRGGGGFGGSSGFHGGGVGGAFRGGGFGAGGFRGGALAPQHVTGGVGSRGGGVGVGNPYAAGLREEGFRAAPYKYGGTQATGRSLGGPTAPYNAGSRTSPTRTYQFSGRGNQSMKSAVGMNATVARQQNRPVSLSKQNMRTSDAQSSA